VNAVSAAEPPDSSVIGALRATLADDLDTPASLRLIDERIASGAKPNTEELAAIDALLGVRL
jgi:hypothetical protein